MATYNGEKYLKEQIDSLLAQTCQDWHLYVHDDGSTDGTTAILRDFASSHPDRLTLLDYPSQGGACQNFLSMMKRVEASYYMFCDQDDVWLPQKIAVSMQHMTEKEACSPGKAVVVYTDLHIVDEQLSVTHRSMWEYSGAHPQYIRTFHDFGGHSANVTGCTMLFNHAAKASCAYPSANALMHDSWVCLCALKQGGILHGIDKPLVLYRQHGDNYLGSGQTEAKAVGLKYRLLNFKKMLRSNQAYYAMLSSLGYGSVLKYIFYKLKFKIRIRRGYY